MSWPQAAARMSFSLTADGSGIGLHIAPIMPHGQPVGGGA